MTPPPLLRSPPFPGIRAAVAAVSRPGANPVPVDPARLDALVVAIRAARVGGDFAAPAAAPVTGPVVRRRDGNSDPWLIADPWSLLGPGVAVETDAADEWALVGELAGAEVRDGRTREARRAALAEALFAPAYRDTFTEAEATPEQAVAILADWRRQTDANRAVATACGMAWWKKRAIRDFLWTGRNRPFRFLDAPAAALAEARAGDGGIAVWPSRVGPPLRDGAAAAGVPLLTVEDGFVRSVGLGSDLHPPFSIVVDGSGIYYDPRGPSDLETLLETADFPPALLARAEAVARTIVAEGIGKYGRAAPAAAPAAPRARRTVLVAGQVEDDQSVRAAGGEVAGNLDLLVRARAAEPDAHILFKPHPDVDAGHRVGRVADRALLAHADAVVRGEPMPALLARVDAVHVLTSLTGFEALLRGLEVTVHGSPFYAGWGLTRDLGPPLPRRTRRLTLAQLVAGTLILYPRYRDPVTGLPCPVEVLLDRFAAQVRPRTTAVIHARRLQGRMMRLLGLRR